MDKEEFCGLTQEHHRTMYEIAYRIVRNEADALDAVSEGMLHAYERRNMVKDKKKFSSWLFRIVRNEAINILRVRKRDKELCSRIVHTLDNEDSRKAELDAAVAKLPEDCREEVILFYYCGLSLKEIAQVREIPIGTVKSRIHRGRKLLRKMYGIKGDSVKESAIETVP